MQKYSDKKVAYLEAKQKHHDARSNFMFGRVMEEVLGGLGKKERKTRMQEKRERAEKRAEKNKYVAVNGAEDEHY